MENIILSIILPVYNVEKYIQRCIDSIYNCLSVPLEHFEVIFIDDESPDDSITIIEHNRKTYSNIRFISQKNKRAGGARNTGIINSRGKYIWFIDPDDTIVDGTINKFIPILKGSDLDIIMCNNNIIYPDKNITDVYGNSSEIMNGINHFKIHRVTWSPCLSFYRRDFIIKNSLKFQENVSFEDIDWVLKTQILAKSIMCMPDIIYNYYMNNTSQTRTNPSYNKVFDWFLMAERIMNLKTINNEISDIIESHSLLVYKRGLRSMMFLKNKERNMLFDKFIKNKIFNNANLDWIAHHSLITKCVLCIMYPFIWILKSARNRKEYN